MPRKDPAKTPAETSEDPRRDYVVTADGWVAGVRRTKGETVRMTPGAAQYETLLTEAPAAGKASTDGKDTAGA